jgi:hypothetical protein
MAVIDRKTNVHLLLEAGAIVISILLAFALDAMWEERQLREWEVGQLQALRDELQENHAALDVVILGHDLNADRMAMMMSQLEAVDSGEEVTFSTNILSSLVSWRTSDVAVGSIDALLASGRLGDIRDPELRKRLALWSSKVLDAQEDEIVAREFAEQIVAASLAGQGVLAAAYGSRRMPGGLSQGRDSDRQITVTVTPEMLDMATARHVHSRMASYSISDLKNHIQEILDLLDAELAEID